MLTYQCREKRLPRGEVLDAVGQDADGGADDFAVIGPKQRKHLPEPAVVNEAFRRKTWEQSVWCVEKKDVGEIGLVRGEK